MSRAEEIAPDAAGTAREVTVRLMSCTCCIEVEDPRGELCFYPCEAHRA